MPNLNKIRGKSLGSIPPGGAPNAGSGLTARGGAASHRHAASAAASKVHGATKYGLSSRNHHNSDPRMGQHLQNTYQNTASSTVPSRGTTVVSRDVSFSRFSSK